MANVYSAIYGDSDYWDGTTEWGYDATSDVHTPTAHVDQTARDAQYGQAYTSLSAWEIDRDGAAGAADTEFGIIQSPWDADDTTVVTIGGWTTTAIVVRAIGAARTTGIYTDGADGPYRIVAAQATGGVILVQESAVTLDGFQVKNTEAVDSSNACISLFGGAYVDMVVSNMVCVTTMAEGIRLNDAGMEVIVYKCIVDCVTANQGQEGIWIDDVNTCKVWNCTIRGFMNAGGQGIEIDAVTTSAEVRNTAICDCTDDINDAVSITIDSCATDEGAGAEGTNGLDISGTWNTTCFTDESTHDYSIESDSPLRDAGDGSTPKGTFTTDIIGTTMGPADADWPIGAFEIAAAGGRSTRNTDPLMNVMPGVGFQVQTPL